MAMLNVKRKRLLLCIALLAFAVCCIIIQYQPFMADSLKNLRVDHVPSELLSYNKLGELFHKLGLIKVTPNHSERYRQQYDIPEEEEFSPFQKRRQISGALLEVGERHEFLDQAVSHVENRDNIESTVAIAVVTEPENIRGEYGVLSNHERRGRNWERLAYVAIGKGSAILENSAAGLRLHGGSSRNPKLEHHSYRLYFRKKYGVQWLDTSPFFDDLNEVRTLVAHVDIPADWPLNNVIANRVYAMIGVPTIEYSQADFFLNGELQGLYWLSPHLSEEYIKIKYNLEEIHYQRYRGQQMNPVYRSDIAMLESEAFQPLTYELLDTVVEVEGLINYFIAVTFSGTTDWNQGVMFKDAKDPNARWHWIAWDLDHSFIDWYGERSRNPKRKVWQQDGLRLLLEGKLHHIRSKRLRLFRRLFNDDKSFTEYFVGRYVDVLNHHLRQEKLIQLHDEYARIIAGYGRQINPLLLDFIRNRHDHIRWEMKHYFKLPDFHKITITGDAGEQINIDGYAEKLPYSGYYPAGTSVKLEKIEETQNSAPIFYLDGKPAGESSLNLTVSKPTTIKFGE